MWGAEELAEDFRACGYSPVRGFNAGSWPLDTTDELHPGAVEAYHGLMIPNLGIEAFKPAEFLEEVAIRHEHDFLALGSALPSEVVYTSKQPSWECSGIPRCIHQTWKSRDITAPFRPEWCATWRDLHPHWEYRLWTDDDLDAFVASEVPNFLSVFRGYSVPIKRVDAARYLILKKLGGVFVDLDFVCLKPLNELLTEKSLVFACQHPGSWVHSRDHVCNALMASVPGHPFWNGVEFDLAANRELDVLEATGPNFLTQRCSNCQFFLDPKNYPTVLSNQLFYPIGWNDRFKEEARKLSPQELAERFPTAYAVTLWTASWW